MKAGKKNNALEGIKKEQLKRRVFTLEFKAEVVRHQKAENLSFVECGRKSDVLPKLIQQWEKRYEAGQSTQAAGRRVSGLFGASWMRINVIQPPNRFRDAYHAGAYRAAWPSGQPSMKPWVRFVPAILRTALLQSP